MVRELYTDEIVTVLVGPEKKPFKFYKGLLCHESSYFKAAFNSTFKEGLEGCVELVEEDPKIFAIFFKWIITSKRFHDDIIGETDDKFLDFETLVKSYVLADMLGVPSLKILCVDTILAVRKANTTKPGKWPTYYLYKNSPKGSAMRRLICDYYVWRGVVLTSEKITGYLPEFVGEYIVALDKRPNPYKREDAPFFKDICQYHDHAAGERCPQK